MKKTIFCHVNARFNCLIATNNEDLNSLNVACYLCFEWLQE
jgi:hypothetical protein